MKNFEMPFVTPLTAQLDITSGCNFRCSFCLTSSGNVSRGELDTQEVKALLDKLHEAGVIFLKVLGGEPFFRKDIIEIFKYAADKGMLISFSTNGSLVDSESARELYKMRDAFQYIQMSLYGYDEKSYEYVTGAAKNFKIARRGLQNLVDAGMRVTVLVVATPENVESLSKYYQLAKDVSVDSFRITPVSDLGKANTLFKQKMMGLTNVYPLLMDQLLALKELSESTSPPVYIDARPLLGQYIRKKTGFKTYFQNCDAGVTSVYINSTGKSAPCPFFEHASEKLKDIYSHLKLEDIKTERFEDIWNNETFKSLRRYFDPDQNKFKIYTGCKYYKSKACVPCTTTPCHCPHILKSIVQYRKMTAAV